MFNKKRNETKINSRKRGVSRVFVILIATLVLFSLCQLFVFAAMSLSVKNSGNSIKIKPRNDWTEWYKLTGISASSADLDGDELLESFLSAIYADIARGSKQ